MIYKISLFKDTQLEDLSQRVEIGLTTQGGFVAFRNSYDEAMQVFNAEIGNLEKVARDRNLLGSKKSYKDGFTVNVVQVTITEGGMTTNWIEQSNSQYFL